MHITLQKQLMGHSQSFLSDHILCYGIQIQYGGCQIQQGWLIFQWIILND